jgi:Tfp pilus assembly protein PilF
MVFAVAVAARAGHVAALAGDPLSAVVQGDGRVYLEWADRIRGGAVVGEAAFYQDPLYPYLLAVWRTLAGESLATLRALHVLLGGLGCVFLASAGRALGGACHGRAMGWFAGLALALHPTSIFLDGLVDKNALVTLLVCGVLVRAVTLPSERAQEREHGQTSAVKRIAAHVGLGVLVGLWMLARGEARLAAALLALWIVWRAGGTVPAARGLAAYLGGVLLAVTPALAHNVAASGEWVLTTAQAGPNLYIGNRAGSTGTYAPLIPGRGDARREGYDARRLAEEAEGRALSSREVSRYWTERTFDELREDPGVAAGRFARKARLALARHEVADTVDFGASVARSPVLRVLAPLVHMGTLLPLALVGLLGISTRGAAERTRRFVPVVLVAGAQLAALVLFYVFARYRFPLVPCFVLFAAEAVVSLPALIRAGGRRAATACALALIGGVAAFWPVPPVIDQGDQLDRYHRATALMELRRFDEAERELAALVRDQPGNVDAWTSLGIARARQRRPDEAVPAFRRARALSPDDPRLAGQLGTALAEAGQLEEAAEVLRDAALADPRHPEVTSNAALLNLQLGRSAAALDVLRARVAAAEDDRGAALQLAWILATSRDIALHDGASAVRYAAPWAVGAGADARDAQALDVYSAALASVGRFDEALTASTEASELLRAAPLGGGDAAAVLKALEARRARYRAHERWVE